MLTAEAPTAYNRDYGRAYLSVEASDIVVKGPFLNALGELYYTHKSASPEDRFFTAGGGAGFENDTIRIEAGSYYQWYKYEYYMDANEVEDVRTYFAGIRITPIKWIGVRLKYELEQFDRLIHTATITLEERF